MSAVPLHRQPRKAEPATSVVIVGSGFTAFECARRLARRLDRARASDVRVTIVSPVDYMLYSPLLADVAGGLVDPRFVSIPLAGTLKGVQAVRGRVDSVDFDRHLLTFTDPEGRVGTLSWDRLVFTPGSVTRLFDTPGLATHARGLKSTAEALYLRDRVLEQLELAHVDENEARAAARRTIVVVGACVFRYRIDGAAAGARRRSGEADGLRSGLGAVCAAGLGRTGHARGGRRSSATAAYAGAAIARHRCAVGHRPSRRCTPITLCSPMIRCIRTLTPSHGSPSVTALTADRDAGPADREGPAEGAEPICRCPVIPTCSPPGDAAAVPAPDTARARSPRPPPSTPTRQGKALARNVAGQPRLWQTEAIIKPPQHGSGRRPRAPLRRRQPAQVSRCPGYPRQGSSPAPTTCTHFPRLVNRWAVALAYLTDVFFPRTVVSMGFVYGDDAQFTASEVV